MAAKPFRDTLIHCEECGEDYSSTYRACPFCGARNDPRRKSGRDDPKSSSRYIPTPPPAQEHYDKPDDKQADLDDTYIFDGQDAFDEDLEDEFDAPRPKGGKRLAPREGGNFELPPINWPRLITFLCSLVIIVAALIIVFTFIYPQLHDNQDPKPDGSAEVSLPPSEDPGPIDSFGPDPIDSEPVEPTDPVIPPTVEPTAPTGTPATVVNASSGLRVRSGPGTTYEVVSSLNNGESITVIAPSDNGWYNISFTGSGGSVITGYIMGDYISTIAGVATTTPPPAVTQTPNNTGGFSAGQTGTITGATGGLRVRSGPGTSYEILDSLVNGNPITVLAPAEGGWYQIRYSGTGGVAKTGYILGDYISVN